MRRLIGPVIMLIAAGCASKPVDLCGQWSRSAEEPTLFLSGVETIDIRKDSTFIVTNTMLFNHSDSALMCSLKLKINVQGKWNTTTRGDILMIYTPETVKIDADSTSFILKAAKGNREISPDLIDSTYHKLVGGVSEYYRSGYTSISANGGMLLESPEIIDSQLYARIGNEIVSWKQY